VRPEDRVTVDKADVCRVYIVDRYIKLQHKDIADEFWNIVEKNYIESCDVMYNKIFSKKKRSACRKKRTNSLLWVYIHGVVQFAENEFRIHQCK